MNEQNDSKENIGIMSEGRKRKKDYLPPCPRIWQALSKLQQCFWIKFNHDVLLFMLFWRQNKMDTLFIIFLL